MCKSSLLLDLVIEKESLLEMLKPDDNFCLCCKRCDGRLHVIDLVIPKTVLFSDIAQQCLVTVLWHFSVRRTPRCVQRKCPMHNLCSFLVFQAVNTIPISRKSQCFVLGTVLYYFLLLISLPMYLTV